MAFKIGHLLKINSIRTLDEKFAGLTLQTCNALQVRYGSGPPRPRLRHPTWLTTQNRVVYEEFITRDNQEFIKEIVQDKLTASPNTSQLENVVEWTPNLQRTGVIARKIGNVPLWLKSGRRMMTTMLQVLDNQVIKYYTPEEYESPLVKPKRIKKKRGCLLLGAEPSDPTLFTKEYCGIFKKNGVLPMKYLARFFISPEAVLPSGTPVNALHFSVGNYIDVRGCTKYRGFQGVMKRHGFSGMPASHGTTKTHRRGGNIGGGGEKGRVWPGTKMPGHMGNRYRVAKGLKIWRINTKHNVLWVSGMGIPGITNSIVYIYDTVLPLRKPLKPLAFPTYLGSGDDVIEEDIYEEGVHRFSDPSIVFDKD